MAIMQIKDSNGNFITIPAIQGPQGATGASGVYYGTEEPTDPTVNLWVDPSGSLTESYSKTQIDTLLNALPKIYVGTSTPTSDVGKDGDLYIVINS